MTKRYLTEMMPLPCRDRVMSESQTVWIGFSAVQTTVENGEVRKGLIGGFREWLESLENYRCRSVSQGYRRGKAVSSVINIMGSSVERSDRHSHLARGCRDVPRSAAR
jgi:hypothetical protein